MGHWFEVWTRPGHATFGRVIDDPASRVGTIHDGVNLLGDGSMAMPASLPLSVFDDILKVDPITPANSVSSLVRLFSEADPTTPVFEFIPRAIVPPQNKNDPDVNVSGWGIKSILEYARTEAFDFDGTTNYQPAQPDWMWGANNLLANPGIEDNQVTPNVYQLIITATGGTYTITDGTDTTLAIAWNANAATIENRIQTDIAAITDLIVDSAGTGTFIITFVDPAYGVLLSVNTGSLTGGSATMPRTQVGGIEAVPWTRARSLATGTPKEIGNYDTPPTPSDVRSHTGTYSLYIDPGPVGAESNRQAGAQQVVSVVPGATYQASIWIYPTSGTDTYQLQIRGIGNERIAQTPVASYTVSNWSQIVLSDILIPDGVTQVIFRVSNMNTFPSNPMAFYLDDAEFYQGLPPDTAGGILEALYDSYVDSSLFNPIYWEDEANPGTPYLTLDFTDAVDSAGVAWDLSEITWTVFQRQSFFQVLEGLANAYNYEFRVVPDDVEAGTWLLQVYNPGGMSTDYSTAATPAIQGGQGDTERGIRRFLPSTYFMVEGANRVMGRAPNADLLSAFGRIAAEQLVRELPDPDSAQDAADEAADDAAATGITYPYVLTLPSDGPTGADTPLDAYQLGDALTIHDPPDVDDVGRLWDVTAVFSADSEEWDVEFLPIAVFESGGSP